MFTSAVHTGAVMPKGAAVRLDSESELDELDFLAADIRNKVNRTHLNVRVVWNETVVPTIEQARCALQCCDPASRAFVRTVLVALRDFDRSL